MTITIGTPTTPTTTIIDRSIDRTIIIIINRLFIIITVYIVFYIYIYIHKAHDIIQTIIM